MSQRVEMILDVNEKPQPAQWILLSFQHVFAMFGATILVPVLTGFPISVALFASGKMCIRDRDARLSFKKDGEGNVSLVPHFIRKEQKLDEYKEHKFSDDDRKNLRETGNLGRVVDLVDRETGEIIPSFVSIDRKTNEITDVPANKVRIPERIGKTEITKQEQDMLRAGLPVRDKLIERKDGRKFVTTLQVNVEQRGVEFVPGTGKSPRTAPVSYTHLFVFFNHSNWISEFKRPAFV